MAEDMTHAEIQEHLQAMSVLLQIFQSWHNFEHPYDERFLDFDLITSNVPESAINHLSRHKLEVSLRSLAPLHWVGVSFRLSILPPVFVFYHLKARILPA